MSGKRRAGRDPVRLPATLLSPTTQNVVIQPILTRREERKQRKRKQRRKYGAAGGAALAALAVALGVTLIIGVHHVVTHKHGPTRTQITVLMQLEGSGGTAEGSMLLAADPATHQGLEVLVPSALITDVCGYGSQNFGDILGLPGGETASRAALSSVLDGVTIDGSWLITPTELSNLVNEVGGINVDVDTDVVQRTTGGGGNVLVAAGPGHLSGAQAVAYATYQSNGGPAAALERLQGVVDATVQALPRTESGIEALVRKLGTDAQSTIGATRLSQLLVELEAEDRTEAGVLPTDLPVTPIDAGAASPSYRPDDSASGIPLLVDHWLSSSLPKNANTQHATVLMLNGIGVPGLVGTACPRLLSSGFTYAGSGNAPTFSQARSQVDIFSDGDVSQGDALAHALGLPDSDVRLSEVNQDVAKFVVILGSDYRP